MGSQPHRKALNMSRRKHTQEREIHTDLILRGGCQSQQNITVLPLIVLFFILYNSKIQLYEDDSEFNDCFSKSATFLTSDTLNTSNLGQTAVD